MDIVEILEQYGFATVAAVAMGYFIYFIYNYVTQNIIEKLDKAQYTTIMLIDRIRMLDNDLIRLRSKLDTILAMRENEEKDGTGNNNKDSNMSLDRRRSSSNGEDGNTKK
jgi:predicted nucleotide-binding protein (sugar kinase/HSP70/actin superfamily)